MFIPINLLLLLGLVLLAAILGAMWHARRADTAIRQTYALQAERTDLLNFYFLGANGTQETTPEVQA